MNVIVLLDYIYAYFNNLNTVVHVPQGQYKKEDHKAQPVLYLPLVDNLLKDNTDGCALVALLHFYCPNAVPLEGTATIHYTAICLPFRNTRWAFWS